MPILKLKKDEAPIIFSAAVAFCLLILKLFAGIISGSIALISDSLDSFTDLLSMAGSYIGIRVSKKKPNNEFNYGFGKAENIASLFVSLLIIFAAISIGKLGYDSVFSKSIMQDSLLAYIATFLSIIISGFLSYYLWRKSKAFSSELLLINSRERLADVFREAVVALSIFLSNLGYSLAQGVVAIIICFAVLFVGMKSLALSVRGLMDSSPNKEIIDRVEKIIRQNSDVNEFHSLRLKKSGPYVFGDVEIHVNKKLSIKEAHSIADKIEKNIKQEFPEIASFLIHVEPNE